MKFKKYTKEQLIEVIAASFSLRTVLKALGIAEAGGNYQTLKRAIVFYEIDTSHFTGCAHLKGKTHTHRTRSIDDICVYGKFENTFRLKNRLIKEKVKLAACEECKLIEWMGIPIPLELHHIDGDKKNNQLSNLAILCPNCHALTTNYRGKNKQSKE